MRLYGGAAFERIIEEFQHAASQLAVAAGGPSAPSKPCCLAPLEQTRNNGGRTCIPSAQ